MVELIWIKAGLIGVIVTLIIILVGLRLDKTSPEEINPDQTDLTRKFIKLANARYYMETDEYQRLLTHCFRIRVNKEIARTFVDVCDDFFAGFHTYAFDMDGRAIEDVFNAYRPEPLDEGECPSDLAPGETIVQQDQLNELR